MTTTTKNDRDRLFAKYFMNHLATLFGPENEAFADLIIMACHLGDNVPGPDADRLLEAVQAAALEADAELAEEQDAWRLKLRGKLNSVQDDIDRIRSEIEASETGTTQGAQS